MLRIGLALLMILASVGASASAATAGCGFCVDNVSLQTRDGQPWTAGKPVTLVVHAAHGSLPIPQTGAAVVMQTDGDRTKCLDVPLKLVSDDGHGAVYAGLFFPFRAARYDGKLSIGDDVSDLTFDVNKIVAGAAPAGDLPAAEPIDTALWSVSTYAGMRQTLHRIVTRGAAANRAAHSDCARTLPRRR